MWKLIEKILVTFFLIKVNKHSLAIISINYNNGVDYQFDTTTMATTTINYDINDDNNNNCTYSSNSNSIKSLSSLSSSSTTFSNLIFLNNQNKNIYHDRNVINSSQYQEVKNLIDNIYHYNNNNDNNDNTNANNNHYEDNKKNFVKSYDDNNDVDDDDDDDDKDHQNDENNRMDNNNNNNNNQKILSRQRRYLTFPEGSSLQVVFDQIIPIVDYTNYLILGITVALAWELPSKKPSEIIDNLKMRLKEPKYDLRKDENIENFILYDNNNNNNNNKNDLNNNNNNNQQQKDNKLWYSLPFNMNSKSSIMDKKYNEYFNKNDKWKYRTATTNMNNHYGFSKFSNFHPPINLNYGHHNYHNKIPTMTNYYNILNPITTTNFKNSSWNYDTKPIMKYNNNDYTRNHNNFRKISSNNFANRNSGNHNRNLKKYPINIGNDNGYYHDNHQHNQNKARRKHRIYPVFGKRSVKNYHQLTRDEKFHLNYHRSSRHGLYLKIEKYLHTQGINGSECILKTLCETGQKNHETDPGNFIGEIMRAIFTLPENFEIILDKKYQIYYEAHLYQENCNEKYPNCKGNFWNDFIW